MSFDFFFYLAMIIASSRAEPLSGDVSAPSSNDFPFIVSIARIFNLTHDNPLGHVCGGTMIAMRYVLTAASCFEMGKTKNNYFVYAGDADLAQSMVVGIKDVIKFDDWIASKAKSKRQIIDRIYEKNDIAVVELVERMSLFMSKANLWNISPELLPFALAVSKWTIQTAGWTKSLEGTPPQYMLKTDLQVVNRDECLRQIRDESNNPFYTHDVNVFCTRGTELFTVLDAGDKGSPIFVEYEPNTYLVIGINLKSVPETNDITRYPNLRNTHVSVNSYIRFLRAVARILD